MTTKSATDDLIDRILEWTHAPRSRAFYLNAIRLLGEGRVNEELGELRYQVQTGAIQSPDRYFARLLQNQLAKVQPPLAPRDAGLPAEPPAFAKTHLSQTPEMLFDELKPKPTKDSRACDQREMAPPYSRHIIPWVTFVGPEFFTLSTNKAKSDRVLARFRTLDGQVTVVPVVRGRIKPKAEERGILTVEHARILGALEIFWVQQGCQYVQYDNGGVLCFCAVSVRDLAKLLGRRSFGGRDLLELQDYVFDLKARPYYLELESTQGFRVPGLKGFGFTLVGDVTLLDKKEKPGPDQTLLRVCFSDTYSRQLLARRAVSRPQEMLRGRMELAFLIRLYLEPIVLGRDENSEHSIELAHLIDILSLPPAGWHKYKSTRKREFEKILRELNGKPTAQGRRIHASIQQGLNQSDYLLVARAAA